VAPPPVSTPPPVAHLAPAYEIISDEELFALLRDRPLLILPEAREGRRIVLLTPQSELAQKQFLALRWRDD